MHEETFDECQYEAVEEPYEPPGILEIILKGLMIVFGIIGVLGTIRWMESEYEPGYRVGGAGFAAAFLMLAAWDLMSRQWRRWRTVWLVATVAVFAMGAISGPP